MKSSGGPSSSPQGGLRLQKWVIGCFLVAILWYSNQFEFDFRSAVSSFYSPFGGIVRHDPYRIYSLIYLDHLNSAANGDSDPVADKLGQPTLDPDTSHLHRGKHAMVSSDVPICSTMGKQILLRNGNAADAAVTVALCIGSVNSHSSGIGGGGFIISKFNDDIISIDARELSPEMAHKTMFDRFPVLSKIGGLAVAVPGELAGLYELYKRHGSGNLTWKELFEPVIELNKEGWKCSKIFAAAVRMENDLVLSKVPLIKDQWDFIFNGDELLAENDTITRPNYAETLSLIAENGSADLFYDPQGPIVNSLISRARSLGGIISASDFANYKPIIEKPLMVNITVPGSKKLNVYTANGVSSGLALISGWNFFNEVYNSNDDDITVTHKLIESFKWLASTRTRLGDVNETRKESLIDKYTNTEWIDECILNNEFNENKTFDWRHYDPLFDILENKGTSHFSVVDKDGNTVGMTTTVNLLFGSMVYDNKTGIILNNEMDDFSTPKTRNAFNLTASVFNFIEPHKRPLSSTAPLIVIDEETGKTDLTIGAAGGSRIPTAILQAIIRLYYQDLSILQALAYPRIHHQLIPEYVMVENSTIFVDEHSSRVLDQLQSYGHDFFESGTLTSMNGIKRNGEYLEGVSDYWRKLGESDGY